MIRKYRSRISGPILDRIDLHVRVPAVDVDKLDSSAVGQSSLNIRNQVISTRKIQETRFKDEKIYTNSQMGNKHVKNIVK